MADFHCDLYTTNRLSNFATSNQTIVWMVQDKDTLRDQAIEEQIQKDLQAASEEAALYDESYDEEQRKKLEQLYEQNTTILKPQQIVKGKVIGKTEKEILVSVGFKAEGAIPKDEFENPDAIAIGDEVEVFIESIDADEGGGLKLSRKTARAIRAWERLNKALENDEIVEGTIIRRTKGGFVVDFDGVVAFLPGSQVDVKPIRDYDAFVGKRMKFKVVKINPAQHNVVVSHKVLIEKELEEQRKRILESLERGQILEGVVKNITPFGVFIDLGGVDGLLRIQDLSWGRVTDPNEILQLDQKIDVVVLDFDEDKTKITLGYKQLQPHPWETLDESIKVGAVVKGKVVTLTPYGVFVEIKPGVEGLIHVNELSWSTHPKDPRDLFNIGDEVEAMIIELDKEARRMALSIKRLQPDPWEKVEEKYPVGSRHKGIVRTLTNFGLFVELEEGVDGFLHVNDLSWTRRINHPAEYVRKGDEIEVVILEVDKEKRRIKLGHKQLTDDPWEKLAEVFPEGSIQRGVIISKGPKGAIVELDYGIQGFCPNALLRTPKGTPALKEGDEADFMVMEFNRDLRRIILSHVDTWQKREKPPEVSEEEKKRYRKPRRAKATLGELAGLNELRKALAQSAKEESQKEDNESKGE